MVHTAEKSLRLSSEYRFDSVHHLVRAEHQGGGAGDTLAMDKETIIAAVNILLVIATFLHTTGKL